MYDRPVVNVERSQDANPGPLNLLPAEMFSPSQFGSGFRTVNPNEEDINKVLATLTSGNGYSGIYASVFDLNKADSLGVPKANAQGIPQAEGQGIPQTDAPESLKTDAQGIPQTDAPDASEPKNVDIHHLPDGDGQVVTNPSQLAPGKVLVSPDVADKTKAPGNVGATKDGPWINSDGTYDMTKKDKVSGDISWPSNYNLTMDGDSIHISGNALPSTSTGSFPIDKNSDAYQYDPNPNSIEPVNFDVTVPRNPTQADTPTPVGLGAVGILKNGGLLYASVDGKGQDANKHETQDDNDGHPSETDYYHTHQVPPALYEGQDKNAPSPVLGRALDGYPIVAAYNKDGDLYSTKDLDQYHGKTVDVQEEDGTVKKEWAYCVSLDWPYTIGAYKGTQSKVNGLQAPGGDQPGGPDGGGAPDSQGGPPPQE